jgi:hypothetical protein
MTTQFHSQVLAKIFLDGTEGTKGLPFREESLRATNELLLVRKRHMVHPLDVFEQRCSNFGKELHIVLMTILLGSALLGLFIGMGA